jgi:DNA topoisomerase VI subunit A
MSQGSEERNTLLFFNGFILVDPDPHGFQIMVCYLLGTKCFSFLNNLTARMKYIGVMPSHLNDTKKLKRLSVSERAFSLRLLMELKSDSIERQVISELEKMLFIGYKGEIESLDGEELDCLISKHLPLSK